MHVDVDVDVEVEGEAKQTENAGGGGKCRGNELKGGKRGYVSQCVEPDCVETQIVTAGQILSTPEHNYTPPLA